MVEDRTEPCAFTVYTNFVQKPMDYDEDIEWEDVPEEEEAALHVRRHTLA